MTIVPRKLLDKKKINTEKYLMNVICAVEIIVFAYLIIDCAFVLIFVVGGEQKKITNQY